MSVWLPVVPNKRERPEAFFASLRLFVCKHGKNACQMDGNDYLCNFE
ncbi:hypothetical protein ACIXN2_00625 [Bacteroides fragilis]